MTASSFSFSAAPSTLSSPVPTSLTASALASLNRQPYRSALSLSGDTPCPTPPESDIDGDTQVGSRSPSPTPDKKIPLDSPPVIYESKEGAEVEEQKLDACTVVELYPEGGTRAYLTVVGVTLVLFATFGFSNSFGSFFAHYQQDQLANYPASTITWIGSTHLFLTFGTSLLSGTWFDKGYFKYQLRIGSALWVFGMFMLSLSKTFIQIFLSQSICLGLALGIMFGPVLSCVGSYFRLKRGFFIGICASGAALGSIMYPIVLNTTFPTLGFAATVRIVAYISTGLLGAANLLIKPRKLPARQSRPALPLLRSFAREPQMWLSCIGVFCGVLGVFIIMFFVQIFTKSHSSNATLQTYSLPILNGCACAGRIVVGLVADRFGPFTIIVPCAAIMGGMVFALLGASSDVCSAFFLLFFGMTSGGFISVMASAIMSLAVDVTELGARSGVGFLFVAFAALIGSPIAGAILAASEGQYWAPCTFAGGSTLVGAGLLFAARRTQVERKGTWRV